MEDNRDSVVVRMAIIETKLDAIIAAINDRFSNFDKRVADLESETKARFAEMEAELDRRVAKNDPLILGAWGAVGIVLAGVLYAVMAMVLH